MCLKGCELQQEMNLIDVVERRALVRPVSLALFLAVFHQRRHHHDHGAAVLPHHLWVGENTHTHLAVTSG